MLQALALPLALTGASFLPALFGMGGGDDDELDGLTKKLQGQSDQNKARGAKLDAEGGELTTPVSQYLKDVIGGDRQALLGATMPQRRMVIDQYDTAKKAISEFTPRGGGLAGSLSQLNANQASDLAQVGGQARTEGMDAASRLGLGLKQIGLSSTELGSMDLRSLISTVLAKSEGDKTRSNETMGGLGEALGSVIGLSML